MGFLFNPSKTTIENLEQEEFLRNRKLSFIFVLYFSLIGGMAFWFFIYYPEPLYYGVPGEKFQADVPSMIVADPILFLIILIIISIIQQFVLQFLCNGFISYKVILRIENPSDDTKPEFKKYLTFYAYKFTPLLFWIPLITCWVFLFEKLQFQRPMLPFFDFTIQNIILVCLMSIFTVWKFIIEIRINKVFFKTSTLKAAIPVLIQIVILIVLYIIADMIMNYYLDTLSTSVGV